MKKSILYFISVCILSACIAENADEKEGLSGTGSRIFSADIEMPAPSSSRVVLEGIDSKWEQGDCIAVFEDTPSPVKYHLLELAPDGKSAVFTTMDPPKKGNGSFGGTNIAVYPYSDALTCTKVDNKFLVGNSSIPALQHYRKDSFDAASVPMVARSKDRTLYFMNAAALLEISVTGQGSIRKIRVEGNSGEQLAGTLVLESESSRLSSAWVPGDASASKAIELDCSADGGVALDPKVASSFIIGMKPTVLDNGFKLTLTDMDGNVMTKLTNKKVSFVGSRILAPASFEFAPDNTKKGLVPFKGRVDIQSEIATVDRIIDGTWVGVGLKGRDYALQLDYERLYKGSHSYRFELRGDEDNTLGSYNGGRKGRTEMSWCYATANDFSGEPSSALSDASILKTVYYHGKGYCSQASSMKYTFAIYVPSSMEANASGIFAQWHGMPSRTLTRNPDGVLRQLTDAEFIELEKTMVIDKDLGYERLPNGKKGNPNGWRFEQGGYPPLSFAFGKGYFYIQANSDRSWLTDKSIRCNINPETSQIGDVRYEPKTGDVTDIKRSTLAYKAPTSEFPRDCWVTFDIEVDWTRYGQEKETAEGGRLDVMMSYEQSGKPVRKHIVDNMSLLIGRNDHKGYYFKFGIYRSDGSVIPVSWSLAGFHEEERK